MQPVVGLGAGGHAKGIIEILQSEGKYEIIGLLDPKPPLWRTRVMGVPVLGGDDLLPDLYDQGVLFAFIGLGMVGNAEPRRRLYEKVHDHGFGVIHAIHLQSVISPSARFGHGIVVMAGAVVNADVWLGNNVIINTSAIVEHDCVIGDHAHIATGAHLAGAVHVGEGSHIGLGASVLQGVRIGKNVIVGAGAVVIDNVVDDVTVVGVPARNLQKGRTNG
jgi:UDP-perosamine 4-acetyltransferase